MSLEKLFKKSPTSIIDMCCEAFCCGALEGYFLNLVNMYYVNIVFCAIRGKSEK